MQFIYAYSTIILTAVLSLGIVFAFMTVFATSKQVEQEQPDITASYVYNTHTMVLGNNVRNLVILIPNEAHESMSQPKRERPLINQPYIPQNAIIRTGTAILWFNSDKAHDHTISLNDSSSDTIFKSEHVSFNNPNLHPIIFNNTGTFKYFEKEVNRNNPHFVMSGAITVVNQSLSLSLSGNEYPLALNKLKSKNGVIDTIGSFMAPSKDLAKYVTELTDKGFHVDTTFTYKDPRGGQKGTGPEQTLIIWATSGIRLETVISLLSKVTYMLPYN